MTKREELSQFATTTSVKGLGRAYLSEFTSIRILWATSVVIFLGLAAFHCISVTMVYLQYPSATRLGFVAETNFSVTSVEIPDVTVCNLNPFSSHRSSRATRTDILTVSQYASMVHNCTDCPETIIGGSNMQELLLTVSAYYQNIGRENATSVGHGINDLFVLCRVDLFDGFASEFIPCKRLIEVFVNPYPSLFNCYTLRIRAHNYSGFISGYKLILHLDNYDQAHRQYLSYQHGHYESAGAIVIPHLSGTKEWLESSATYLHPGTAVDLKLRIQAVHHLGPPYGSCAKRWSLVYNHEHAYTHIACVSGCLQDLVLKDCGCLDVNFLDVLDVRHTTAPYCLSFTGKNHINETLASLACAFKRRAEFHGYCQSICPVPCDDVVFKKDISKTEWPRNLYSKTFYRANIEGRPWESRYNTTDRTLYYRLIKDNFISVDVYAGSFDVRYLWNEPRFSSADFISQLGAALNLWAGIKTVIFIEIIELILRMRLRQRNNPNGRQATPSKRGEDGDNSVMQTRL